ncbi:uncharacterized protein UV8b_04497 [Ustilaginoidea virens]|uniref:Uncharacterized protein n=1 Tax=Ustilaginoidea virens TaxID=1159556 RepID=A0A8E5MI10_USTVR|nr:uncharacterized protein UV8b_04497 [Ustilaginoidea virens]QUC20256.1 hypothetical protein UV8b_04497 [Ustilaginoidea virens]
MTFISDFFGLYAKSSYFAPCIPCTAKTEISVTGLRRDKRKWCSQHLWSNFAVINMSRLNTSIIEVLP